MALKCGICAIAKDEGPYIEEWVDFHFGIGFSSIAIYDNDSSDGGMDNIKYHDGVSVVDWPSVSGQKAQNSAYEHFFLSNAADLDWVIHLDIDEFINIKCAESVSAFLEEFEQAGGVTLNWRMFGSSGHQNYVPGSVLRRFIHASLPGFGPNAHVKTFYRPSAVERPYVHSPLFLPDAIINDSQHHIIQLRHADILNHNINLERAQINHYFTKSREEFLAKVRRGKADHATDSPGKYRDLAEFEVYDRNEEEDTTVFRLLRA